MEAVPRERLETARRFLRERRPGQARRMLRDIEGIAGADAMLWRGLGEAYTVAGSHYEAERCYRRAVRLRPGDPRALYDLGAAQTAMGDLASAQESLGRAIALDPDDFDAWYNLVTLSRATPDANHLSGLRKAAARAGTGPGRIPVHYALAKELEDLGRHRESFAALKIGADARRQRLSYRVEGDVETIEAVIQAFTPDLFKRVTRHAGQSGPIFVMGLPRTGTTLVDRILSAHSRVGSLGEISDFALALTARAAGPGGKLAMVERSRSLDFKRLGQAYLESTAEYGVEAAMRVDKTPSNFLYLGLIALALPQARIIHLRRNPADSLYAIYKTLFRMGYPFSYSLDDLAAYYIAYHRLMEHWRGLLPGRFMEVDYEALVGDQEGVTRAMLDWSGLDFEEACLRFHENVSPSATASAAQVRRPLYSSSVGLWRHYEAELAPLVARLVSAGLAPEGHFR
jgi:tetratricopeptide (TPR) repeat protein